MNRTKRTGRWLGGLTLAALATLRAGAQEPGEAEPLTSDTQDLSITPIGGRASWVESTTATAVSTAPHAAASGVVLQSTTGTATLPFNTLPPVTTPPPPVRELRFNFQGVPLDTVLNYMSQAAGFIIVRAADIDGRVNVISQQPLNPDQSVELLNTVLNEKGFAAIRNDRTLTIVTRDEARRRELPVIMGADPTKIPKSDKMVTQIIPVRYVNAKQLVTDLAALVPEHASMTANESSNTILLTDTQASVRHITEIIQGLDSSISEISTLKVFTLKYADAKSVADLVKALYTTTATGTQQNGDDMRRQIMQRFAGFGGGARGGGDQPQNQSADNAALQAASKVTAVADERTNSLVVSAPDATMGLIESLVEAIDTETNALTEVKVFPLQFADATQTADLIKGVFAPDTVTQAANQQNQGNNRRFTPPWQQPQQPAQAQNNQSTRQKTESTVLAVPDTRTNSVIVSASESSMQQIDSMIEQLDKNPAKNKKVFVYSLKNANPQDVAAVLGDMFGANATGGTKNTRTSTSSTSRNTNGSNNPASSRGNNNNSNSSSRGSSGSGSSFSR